MTKPDGNDPREPRIIDLEARRKLRDSAKRRKRRYILLGVAAGLLLVGAVIFVQLREVLNDTAFWGHFALFATGALV